MICKGGPLDGYNIELDQASPFVIVTDKPPKSWYYDETGLFILTGPPRDDVIEDPKLVEQLISSKRFTR
jgi:hypothetical protein